MALKRSQTFCLGNRIAYLNAHLESPNFKGEKNYQQSHVFLSSHNLLPQTSPVQATPMPDKNMSLNGNGIHSYRPCYILFCHMAPHGCVDTTFKSTSIRH